MDLSKLLRSASLAITEAMKTIPTAAKQVLQGLPLLHVMTEAEVQEGIYGLNVYLTVKT